MNTPGAAAFRALTNTQYIDAATVTALLDNCIVAMRARGATGMCNGTLPFDMWKDVYIQQLGWRPIVSVLYSIASDMLHHQIFMSQVMVENPVAFHAAIEQGNLSEYYQRYR